MTDKNPVLRKTLRETYREDKPSSYLSGRILESVERTAHTHINGLKLGGAFACLFLFSAILFMIIQPAPLLIENQESYSQRLSELSRINYTSLSSQSFDMPDFHTLNIPDLNQLERPTSISISKLKICVYPTTGEISC